MKSQRFSLTQQIPNASLALGISFCIDNERRYSVMLSILRRCTPAGTCTSTTSPTFLPSNA